MPINKSGCRRIISGVAVVLVIKAVPAVYVATVLVVVAIEISLGMVLFYLQKIFWLLLVSPNIVKMKT